MNAKQAITAAKLAFADLFTDEPIQNLGLEEIDFDDHSNTWRVTLGFYRTLIGSDPFGVSFPSNRIYKIVSIANADGQILSVKNRDVVDA